MSDLDEFGLGCDRQKEGGASSRDSRDLLKFLARFSSAGAGTTYTLSVFGGNVLWHFVSHARLLPPQIYSPITFLARAAGVRYSLVVKPPGGPPAEFGWYAANTFWFEDDV